MTAHGHQKDQIPALANRKKQAAILIAEVSNAAVVQEMLKTYLLPADR